jgi:transposase InsO family protein
MLRKRTRSLRESTSQKQNHPIHSEAVALVHNNDQLPSETSSRSQRESDLEPDQTTQPNPDYPHDYEYREDETDDQSEATTNENQTSSSSSTGTSSVIPIVLGNSVTATTAAIASGSPLANAAEGVLQMGNVIQNDPPIRKRDPSCQTQHTLFNMRKAVILSDVVNAKLAKEFLIQATDPTFQGTWQNHIQKKALRAIRFRLQDITYRSLVPQTEINIWPAKSSAPAGQPLEYSLLVIAETIMKIYAPETAPNIKSIDQRIKEAPFGYKMKDQSIEEGFLGGILDIVDNFYLGVELPPEQDNKLAKEVYKKLPKNTGMARQFAETTLLELNGKLDTVELACHRIKALLALVRQSIRIAASYGPEEYVYHIDSRDKEISTIAHSPPTPPTPPYDHSQNDRRASDVTAQTPAFVERCECCGQWGHSTKYCRWAKHPMANNTNRAFKNSHAGINIWGLKGLEKLTPNRSDIPGYEKVLKDDWQKLDNDYNARRANNPPGKRQNVSANYQGSNPRPYDQLYRNTSSTNSNENGNQQRSKSLPLVVCSTITDTELTEYLDVTVSKQITTPGLGAVPATTGLKAALPRPPLRPLATRDTDQPTRGTEATREGKAPRGKTNPVVKAKALLDTGSLPGNFITVDLLKRIHGSDSLYKTDQPIRVCSGLDNHCIDSSDVVDVMISFYVKNKKYSIPLTCRITLLGQVDLIIGRESIKKHKLVSLLPNFFFDEVLEKNERDNNPYRHTNCSIAPCGCDIDAKTAVLANGPDNGFSPILVKSGHHSRKSLTNRVHFDDTPLIGKREVALPPTPSDTPHTWGPIATILKQNEQLSEVDLIGSDEINSDTKDTFGPFRVPDATTEQMSDAEFISRIVIEGTQQLQEEIKKVLLEFKDIFSDKLKATPADIPPFDLDVDKKIWETYRNRGPVRVQTEAKQKEIQKQTQQMLAAGIIEVSPASFYSQVHIAPKPGGFRFCIDFRKLNDATASASWPLPNIQQMIIRIGAHRASIYGIMDLTLGYHQAPISLATRIFTAFITFAGIFQFTRLPFGPKRAPSYFQEMMASVILVGLIYFICEVYLDDVIIFGDTPTEFIERMRTLFTRFRLKNICLKASKCKFGLSKIEYVGRTISKEGVSMSTKKINSVLDIPKPMVNTQLRSFLGLANYFKDFVPNHSNVVSPLFKMVDHSAKKQTALKWTPEGDAAFINIRLLIANSPTLYFIKNDAPIYLMTDASDYGIGGYLYQVINYDKQLVALVSKSLTPTQLAWSTIQKEAYAIFFCCTHLDNLLRDRQFTILTDHKNLTFIKQASNPMIVRWHLALQELDFEILFVPGVDNVIADAMSRLCINNKPEVPTSILSAIHGQYVINNENYQNISKVHNAMVGHGGVERTLRKLRDLNLSWNNMRLDVKTYIRECPCCQKMSQVKIPIIAFKYTTSTYRPMECLNIDFMGPYPDQGYVLNIVDTFTRWVELYAVPNATAEEACRCLLVHFGRFGSPTVIRSDKGPHFANTLIEKFLKATGTLQNLTLAYSSQENSIVERNNKEINRHLRALTFDTNTIDDYQILLPFVQRIMNSSYNERTKISPADLLFGNSLDLSGGIYNSIRPNTPNTETQSQSMDKMISMQSKLINISKRILEDSDKEHNSHNSASITEFPNNSFVLVAQRTTPETRLHTLWRGPMKVIDHKQGEYTLLDLTTNKEKLYHSTQMRKFLFDPIRTNPTDVSRKDYLEFFIESILQHKGDPKRLSTLEFKIKWLGYDDTYNTWEPWANLREMEILHQYLMVHNMRQTIPNKFKGNYPN